MTRQRCDVRWAEPAIEAFLSKYGPEDADAVNAILIQIRDQPDDVQLRRLVDPGRLRAEIENIEGSVFYSTDGTWDVYYNWSPEHLIVLLAEKHAPANKR